MGDNTQRALRVFKALRGHSLDGISNGELSKHLREPPDYITRVMQDLIAEGLVEKLDNGRFAHSQQTAQIAIAHLQSIQRAEDRINEFKQRAFAGIR